MKPTRADLFGRIGLEGVPWTIRVYLYLVVLFLALTLATAFLNVSSSLGTLAEDGLKMVLGALLGSLALMRDCQVDGLMKDDGAE